MLWKVHDATIDSMDPEDAENPTGNTDNLDHSTDSTEVQSRPGAYRHNYQVSAVLVVENRRILRALISLEPQRS